MIRAQKFTFKGDEFALQGESTAVQLVSTGPSELQLTSLRSPAAHQQTRIIFSRIAPSAQASTSSLPASSSASPDAAAPLTTAEIDENIQSAFEIATYLRRNVVQGIKTEEGKYGTSSPPRHRSKEP